MLDFVRSARSAEWYGGQFALSDSVPERLTEFGMNSANRRSGYVHVFDEPARFENNRFYDQDVVLHTHPAWTDDGMIVGIFPEMSIRSADEFLGHVGLLAGSRGSDGVEFEFGLQRGDLDVPVELYFNADSLTRLRGFYRRLASTRSSHDGRLDTLRADLAEFSRTRRSYRPVLIVRTAGSSRQDWAAWVRPRIERVRSISIPHAECMLESTSGNFSWIRNRRRRVRSDEFALFISAVSLDESEVPIPGTFQAQVRSMTNVDSGEFVNFDDIRLEFVDPAIRYAEIRMIGLEIDGTGATSRVAEHGFNNWSGTFFLTSDGSRYAFNEAFNGPRGTNNHNLLLADYWIVDFERLRDGGRDPEGRVLTAPGERYGSVEEYLSGKRITRDVSRTTRTSATTESRRYTAAVPDSIYEVRLNYR